MQQAVEFLLSHIEIVVFLTVLAEQIGLPIPAVPVLLAAGAVAADGGGAARRADQPFSRRMPIGQYGLV
jgi:membrane protein DedA with SNARE-associated domain